MKNKNKQKGRKRTRTRRAGWQTVEALPFCWSIGGEVWRCGGDCIAKNWTRWPPVPLPER